MNQFKETFLRYKRQYPLLWHLLLISLTILALALASHFLMQIGTRHSARCTVPDYSGVHINEALKTARKSDLKILINDSLFVPAYDGGVILDQLPEGGTEVKPGRTVYVTINSFQEKMVPVPFVAGYSLRQAKNMLETGGLEIEKLVYEPDLATNYVLAEYCKGRPVLEHTRMTTEFGTGITLHVGMHGGMGYTIVPMTVGLSLKDAKSRLWESGLNVDKIEFDEGINLLNRKNARVYMQTPEARRGMPLGTGVRLRLTLDTDKLHKEKVKADRRANEIEQNERRIDLMRRDSLARIMGDSLYEVRIDSLPAPLPVEDITEED